jgi:hypothetical protein
MSIILFFILLTHCGIGQTSIDKTNPNPLISFMDVYYNLSFLVPEYYEKNEIDSIYIVLDYMDENFFKTTTSTSIRILLAIEKDSFTEGLYDSTIIERLVNYHDIPHNFKHENINTSPDYENDPFNKREFFLFTQNLAEKILANKTNLNNIESFFLDYYSGVSISLKVLEKEEFNGSMIQYYYQDELKKHQRNGFVLFEFNSGIWIPQSNLSILGVHPYLGIGLGGTFKSFFFDFVFNYRFVGSPNYYEVEFRDSIWNTNTYSGIYLGLDFGYQLFAKNKNSFDIIGGIAFEEFVTINVTYPENPVRDVYRLNSLNLNIGLAYKYYFNPRRFLGIDVKYNFVNFKNPGGTDLSGNIITISLKFGILAI